MQKFRKIPKASEDGPLGHVYEFGPFRIDAVKHLLLRGTEPVSLTPKALDVLCVLVEHRGEVLVKEELIQRVWPDTVVEEGNLNRNISTLRRALGELPNDHRYVVTVPGRGYRFVAEVREVSDGDSDRRKRIVDRGRIQSIAVLPFLNLSAEPEQEHFADGLTDALLTDLAQIHALRVVSRTSVMRYKGTQKSLPEIARELNVDAVVEGSVMRSGGRVRITVQLIKADTDEHLWANAYEGEIRDVLGLQSGIARAVVREIHVTLTPAEQARLATVRVVNPIAHEAYLKGRYLLKQRLHDSLRKSVAYFEQAIENDPSYAEAYGALAEAYAVMAIDEFEAPEEFVPKARRAAQKSLELDDQLSEIQATLALLKFWYEWDLPGAEQQFRSALQICPNCATAHHWYALVLMYQRRFSESFQEFRKAQDLDPLSPIIRAALGLDYVFAGRYDDAIRQAETLLEIDPNSPLAHDVVGFSYQRKGLHAQAIAALQKYVDLSGRASDALMRLGCAYAASGDADSASKLLDELRSLARRQYVSPGTIAALDVALGNKEGALMALEAGVSKRSASLLMLAADPVFDPLRSEPRFQTLLQCIGLPS
jgi:TolB-like protein/Tfp pilus assembly protein PilF